MAMKLAGQFPLDEAGRLHHRGETKEAEAQRGEGGINPIMITTKTSSRV
jgi:hypothetical protein